MADFYGTVEGYKAFAADRGLTVTATDPDIQAALVRSTNYIDGTYRNQFPGFRANNRHQPLEWPRSWASDREGYPIDPTIVPPEVDAATYEGAKREIASPFSLAPDIKPGGGVVKRVKAGSVEVEYESNAQLTKTYQAIEQALGPILTVRSNYSGMAARA